MLSESARKKEYALEHYRQENEGIRQFYSTVRDTEKESIRAVLVSGQAASRSLLFLSGGGAVAALAFIGHLASSNTDLNSLLPIFFWALVAFVASAFVSTLTIGGVFKYWCERNAEILEANKDAEQRLLQGLNLKATQEKSKDPKKCSNSRPWDVATVWGWVLGLLLFLVGVVAGGVAVYGFVCPSAPSIEKSTIYYQFEQLAMLKYFIG